RGRRAARLYERAGERAARSLAFRRASELYALGRECADDDSTRQRLDVARARALGSAGLHRSAADAFEQALRGRALVASDSETMTLQRERAEHLLHAGAMREGERALETCLRALGLRSRPTRRGLLASILMHQLWLRTLGTRGPRAPSAEPSRLEQARVDLCFSAALALTNVDTLRGMDFALCSARRAHTLGDRHRFARSYALITAYSGSPGGKARARVSPMIARVCRFAEEFSDPRLRGMAQAAECLLLFHSGEHAESLALAEQAETTFREEAGAPREATTALIYRCANLASLGRFEALAETRRELLDDSLARHDGFGETHARSGLMNLVWLVDDDPETAEEELRRGMERWREVEFQFAHFFALLAGSRIDLYRGAPAACLERLSAASGGLASSLFLRMPYVRAQISDLHGRAWLALAAQDSSKSTRRRALREARREVRRIRGLGAAIHAPLADVIEAGTTLLLGRESEARTLLRAALHAFDERGLQGHAFTTTHVLEALGDAPARCLPDRDAPKDATRFVCALGLATAGA
ncbi:MAG: hypothetical protein GXP55_11900, partial [Deltaproteobacteria bacterium]|nr:hypothetical protein [Deltaproteobacteria bacterium]